MQLNDRDILEHTGKVSHQMAKQLAKQEYDKFHQQRQAQVVMEVDRRDLDYLAKVAGIGTK